MNKIKYHKNKCKLLKKFDNPNNLTLMQIQHKYARELGYYKWSDLLDKEKNNVS